MPSSRLRSVLLSGSALLFVSAGSGPVLAQDIPGSADPSRFIPRDEDLSRRFESVKTGIKNRIAGFQISDEEARKAYRMNSLVVDGLKVYSLESVTKPNAHLMG